MCKTTVTASWHKKKKENQSTFQESATPADDCLQSSVVWGLGRQNRGLLYILGQRSYHEACSCPSWQKYGSCKQHNSASGVTSIRFDLHYHSLGAHEQYVQFYAIWLGRWFIYIDWLNDWFWCLVLCVQSVVALFLVLSVRFAVVIRFWPSHIAWPLHWLMCANVKVTHASQQVHGRIFFCWSKLLPCLCRLQDGSCLARQ